MRQTYRARWVQREAAKHTTSASIRRRIEEEIEQIRILWGTGLATESVVEEAVENHKELIRVLTERLDKFK